MPAVNIPDDFLSTLDGQYRPYANEEDGRGKKRSAGTDRPPLRTVRARRRRDVNSAMSINGSNGVDRVDVYIGFIFDGYTDYDNINGALPGTRVAFYSPPEIIPPNKEPIRFDANKDETIDIKVYLWSLSVKEQTQNCKIFLNG